MPNDAVGSSNTRNETIIVVNAVAEVDGNGLSDAIRLHGNAMDDWVTLRISTSYAIGSFQ